VQIPIVIDHCFEDVIGRMYDIEGKLYIEFNEYMPESEVYSIINCGAIYLDAYTDSNGNELIKALEVVELSLSR